MGKIKNIIFDLGGVILTLSPEVGVRRFVELGIKDAGMLMDTYTQSGIFGDLECGKITAEEFRLRASSLVGYELTCDQCRHAWLGYAKELPERNKQVLRRLRNEGFHLILLSNTNPYMMSWVNSPDFDGEGHSISDYMDACYLSYDLGVMKPDPRFFRMVLDAEQIDPSETLFLDDGSRNVSVAETFGIHTMQPINGEDWTVNIYQELSLLDKDSK